MFFRRKGQLKKEFDEKLLTTFVNVKSDWLKQTDLIEKSVDPSDEVLLSVKVARVKYLYLLREAKKRNISIGKM
ncbi:YaaL family protein [Priestia abyssalis]|uniref:YaaL family protein n=1 Tax=Priestia abyssalis TaxID=1221450 RepID=UPI000994B4C7|nr:YaaL family protein [Priestia abyssalis]